MMRAVIVMIAFSPASWVIAALVVVALATDARVVVVPLLLAGIWAARWWLSCQYERPESLEEWSDRQW